jgi:putative MATE family efflux protein
MRHTVVMAFAASIGLVSIFLVDFVDLFFISLLGEESLAAAVGFAGTILYFGVSITIGLMIAMGALAAQRLGAGEPDEARRIATSVIALGLVTSSVIALIFWICAPYLLGLLGAKGDTLDHAVGYLRIVVLSMPIAALGMMSAGLLRAHGDARRAMFATLSAGIVNAVMDPILIFGFGLGLDGAAYASVLARCAMAATAVVPILRHYGGFARLELGPLRLDLRPIAAIAIPAILTNIATPIGNSVVTRAVSGFGDSAVAGYAVIGRLTPLAFCVVFALSGAVGPIIGQNFGAKQYDRVKETILKAARFVAAYVLVMWGVLVLAQSFIANQFGLSEEGSRLVFWFAAVSAPLFFFNGILFVSNASFNNLRRPIWSTWLNWLRNTVGVVPFIWVGAIIGGAPGVIVGRAVGGVMFGILGLWLAVRLARAYESGDADPDGGSGFPFMRKRPSSPFSSPR